jgi:hypothetical protein
MEEDRRGGTFKCISGNLTSKVQVQLKKKYSGHEAQEYFMRGRPQVQVVCG